MRCTVRLSSVRSLVSAVLVSSTFIFQSEDFSHFGGRIERLRPGPDALRNVHRKRGILRVFEAAFDHLAQGERFAAAGVCDTGTSSRCSVSGIGRIEVVMSSSPFGNGLSDGPGTVSILRHPSTGSGTELRTQ